jgi:hypothetical protein
MQSPTSVGGYRVEFLWGGDTKRRIHLVNSRIGLSECLEWLRPRDYADCILNTPNI